MGITVSMPELSAVIRDLRSVDRKLANAAKKKIREAEEPAKQVMRQAALSASPGPMEKAAGAVVTRNRFAAKGAVLSLRVDSKRAPNARPLDKPNNGDFDRHPVYGNRRNWVDQPARRFFDRGADAAFRACEKEMEDALSAVVRALS